MIDKRNRISVGESRTRLQNDTDETTITSAWTMLYRIVASNSSADTVYTVTVKDSSTTLIVLRVPFASTISVDIGTVCAGGLKLQNSNAALDTLAIYDTTK